jgi:hypothetical protein
MSIGGKVRGFGLAGGLAGAGAILIAGFGAWLDPG